MEKSGRLVTRAAPPGNVEAHILFATGADSAVIKGVVA
jgi:hypothetical protein